MDVIQVRAFGKLTLNCGNRLVAAYPTRRVEELLGFLLLHQQESHRQESLIELLWPKEESLNGRNRLSKALWRLNNLIDELGIPPESCLDTTGDAVIFAPQPAPEMDVTRFEERLFQAEATDIPAERERLLRQAHNLYRGPLCEGLVNDWCLIERERLARLHLRTLGQLMACCIGRRAYEEAIAFGDLILNEDPLREEVYRAQIICCGYLDQGAEAARRFQRCANYLMAEYHILPLPETIAAYVWVIAAQSGRVLGRREDDIYLAGIGRVFDEFIATGDKLAEIVDSRNRKLNNT